MTVRANKPAFNIREKLKELTHNIGLKGRELMGAATVQEARDLVSAGRKNIIHNGNMEINQRGASSATTLTTEGFHLLDRWAFALNTAGTWTASQQDNTSSTDPFRKSYRVTVNTTASFIGNTYCFLGQGIEGHDVNHLNYGTNKAKPLTLSFWVKSNYPGRKIVEFELRQNPGVNKSISREYTINSADTWEYKTITIPGNSEFSSLDGTVLALRVFFWIAAGTDFTSSNLSTTWTNSSNTSRVSGISNDVAENVGGYFEITGVQLEVGKNATDFEYRSFAEELALCQRYYRSLSAGRIFSVSNGSGTAIGANIHHPVTMRPSPSPTFYGSNSTTGNVVMYSSEPGNQTNYITAANNFSGAMNGIECFGWNASSFSPGFPSAASGWIDLGFGSNNLRIEFSSEI